VVLSEPPPALPCPRRLVEEAQQAGLAPKPELGIQLGAGGASSPQALAAAGTRDVRQLLRQCARFLEVGGAGAWRQRAGLAHASRPLPLCWQQRACMRRPWARLRKPLPAAGDGQPLISP
jgi:hypothetical protein